MTEFKLFVLGAPRIERDGWSVELSRRKAFALLVYLAVTGETHRRDTLATLFWPEFDQERARAALRRTLASVKQELHPSLFEVNRETIGLRRLPSCELWSDVGRFHSLLQACWLDRHGEFERCTVCPERVAEAVALYRGPFLAGLTLRDSPGFDEWQLWQAEMLQQELARALEHLIQTHIERQEYEGAIEYNRRWLALDPLNEPAARNLMSLYSWTGQRQAALRQYAQLCRLLELELGLSPQLETVELYQALRETTPISLEQQLKLLPFKQEESKIPSALARSDKTGGMDSNPRLTLFDSILRGQLVGRERELAQMLGIWQRAVQGEGQVLFLSGEAGIGKTRLARELATLAETSGAIVLVGRCQPSGDGPYAPFAQLIQAAWKNPHIKMGTLPEHVMADLLMIAPHLGPRFPRIRNNPRLNPLNERQRIFESFASWCEWLTTTYPILLWLEDLHWSDDDTLALLHYVALKLHRMRLFMVVTYRDTELALAEYSMLPETILALNRARLAATMSLNRLNREQTRQQLLAMLATGEEISDEFLTSVYQQCEGNPFYLEEVLKALVDEEKLYRVGEQWRRLDIEQIIIPSSIQAAILSRVTRLPRRTQEVLYLAAVMGREFDIQLLRAAGHWDLEQLTENLEYAKRAHLLVEPTRPGDSRMVFAHSLIPFALRAHLGVLRLQHLHQRIAMVIETRHPGRLDSLAHHYTAAGDSEKAITYSLRAAEQAERAYAHDSAIQYLHTALQLVEAAGPDRSRIETLERLADILRLRGSFAQAAQRYQEALAYVAVFVEPDILWMVRLQRKLGETVFGTEWIEEVKPFVTAAYVALEEGLRLLANWPIQRETVRLLICRSLAAWRGRASQDWEAAERYAAEALSAAEALGQPVELSAALNALAIVTAAQGRYQERVEIMQRRLALSRDPVFPDVWERVHVLNETGVALSDVGRYAEAINYHEEAEYLGLRIRAVEEVLYSLKAQALCAYRLDRWDMVLMEEKFRSLRQTFHDEHLSPMCMHLALQAAVLALRGQFGRARALRDESMALMTRAEPPEKWGRPAHY